MKSDVSQGKISIGMQGQGTVTEQMIERRARQIAVINGRTEDQVNEGDRQQAKEELTGLSEQNHLEPDEIEGETGHQGVTLRPDDEQTLAETAVSQGMDEALHDEMLEHTKTAAREDKPVKRKERE